MSAHLDTREVATMVETPVVHRDSPDATAAPPAVVPPFRELFDAHFDFVWRTAHRLGTPEASLDDVVQEVFVVAFRRRQDFAGRSSVKTWLYGIAFNVVRAHRRELGAKHPAAVHADPDGLADDGDRPDEWTAKREAARFVDQFLQGLNEDQRDVFVLTELEGLSAPEVAGIVGAPLNTVYSRIRLARVEFSRAVARHRARNEGVTR